MISIILIFNCIFRNFYDHIFIQLFDYFAMRNMQLLLLSLITKIMLITLHTIPCAPLRYMDAYFNIFVELVNVQSLSRKSYGKNDKLANLVTT